MENREKITKNNKVEHPTTKSIQTERFVLSVIEDDPLGRKNIIFLKTKEGEGTGIDLDEIFKEKM